MAEREMTGGDVCRFLDLIEPLGIEIWLDGGWAVDAWLGRQTRQHADVDIVIEAAALATLVAALRARGYDDVPRDDTRRERLGGRPGALRDVRIEVPPIYLSKALSAADNRSMFQRACPTAVFADACLEAFAVALRVRPQDANRSW